MDSEKEKAKSEQEHLTKAAQYAEIQHQLKYMEKDMPRNIAKARPYFEMKDKLEFQLQVNIFFIESSWISPECALTFAWDLSLSYYVGLKVI